MATVADLIERVNRDYLYRIGNQPSRTILDANLDAGAPQIRFNNAMLSTVEQNRIVEGTVVEADRELMVVNSFDIANGTLTVSRGRLGTTDAAHTKNTFLYIEPPHPRQSTFDAVVDAIVNLHPSLYHAHTLEVTAGTTPVELPARVYGLLNVRARDGGEWRPAGAVFTKEDPTVQAAATAYFPEEARGTRMLLTTKRKLSRPEDETTEVDEIEPEWEALVVMGAAITRLMGVDLDAVSTEYLVETFERQNFPAGTGTRIAAQLTNLYEYRLSKAERGLIDRYGVPVIVNGVTYGGGS